MQAKVQAVREVTARDMLTKLLHPDPARRVSAADALEHLFFKTRDDLLKMLQEAEEKQRVLEQQLEEAKRQGKGSGDAVLQFLMVQMQENAAHKKNMEEQMKRQEERMEEMRAGIQSIDER